MRKEVTQCYTLHILAPLTRMGGCEPTDKSCAGSEAVLVETGLVGSQSRIECQRLSTGACGPVRDSWGSRKHKKNTTNSTEYHPNSSMCAKALCENTSRGNPADELLVTISSSVQCQDPKEVLAGTVTLAAWPFSAMVLISFLSFSSSWPQISSRLNQ